MKSCSLSVILPVHGSQENLDRILTEFLQNSPDESWELIVIDDGSSTPLSFKGSFPSNWTIVRSEHQQGAAVSRNVGARHANGEHLVFLSVFLLIPSDYILRLQGFIASTSADFSQHLIQKPKELKVTNFQGFLLGQEQRLTSEENLPVKQSLFTAATIKKQIFDAVGGFDETMQHYGGHEMDLIYRLDQAGYQKRNVIPRFPLQRNRVEKHQKIRERLLEYGQVGLPALLKKHPELTGEILIYPKVWSILSLLRITHKAEKYLKKNIEKDLPLQTISYRLYLHLIMRNAWDAH